FTIDGIALPEGVYSVDRMPAGIHELAISQERPYGLYESVHEIEVVEEIENRITISLPDIAGEEIPVFRQADRYLTLLTTGKETGVVLAMNNLNSLLDTSFFQEFRSGVVQKYDRWVSMLEEDVLLSYKTDRLKPAYYVRSLWDSERKKSISNEVSLSSNNRIQQSAFETLVSNEYMLANIQTIVIDGNGADWNNITSIYNDALNDFASQSGNHLDIEQIKFAIDHKYLYIYAETVDGFDSSDYMFNWHTSDSTHVLYFDFFHWKGVKEIDISIGYVEHGSDKHQRFKQFEQKIDAVYGKIFEAAIPLDYLMDFSLFSETMEIRGRTEDWTVSESFDVDDFNFTLQLPILEAMIKSGNDSNVFTDSVKLWDFNESKDGWRTAGNEKLSIEKIEGRNVLKLGFDGRENVIELKSQSFDTMDFSNKSVEIKFWGPSEWTRDMEIQFTAFNNSGRWKGSEGVSDAYSVRKNSWNIQRYNFYPTTRGEGDIKKIRSISFE
ncbi:MAG: hypothetical protein KAR20_10135, partial [Candidatus Heimdallarchaeota archaeon]|nr:hypothetical protein [Candidatus Heimdallarchaeota archaeon]